MKRSGIAVALLMSSALVLSACNTESEGEGEDSEKWIDSGLDDASLGGWFVTEFDEDLVRAVRETTAFVAQDLRYRLAIEGHPDLDGSQIIESNPYRAIGVDYARSVGLTGKGVTISIVDSPVYEGHEVFDGKDIDHAPGSATGADYHGTAVAGIAAGSLGVAPGADIHFGAMDYDDTADIDEIASFMRDARAQGALVSNNSWGFSLDVTNPSSRHLFSTAPGRRYLDALRDFASDGIVIFASSNEYDATGSGMMAGLPLIYPELESGWITVINGIPTMEGDRVESAIRVSSACLQAAEWCLAADGQVRVATTAGGYELGGGASYATPQVAGGLALLAEAFPDLSSEELRARLLVTADNGFFEHDGEVEFAPGLSHGYNSEWGHGFADFKAALLPIGVTTTPTANGGRVRVSDLAIGSGTATGDAIAKALSGTDILVEDQMFGSFSLPANGLVTNTGAAAGRPLSEIMVEAVSSVAGGGDPSMSGARAAHALGAPAVLGGQGMYSLEDAAATHLLERDGIRLAAILPEDEDRGGGIALARTFEAPGAAFELGVEALREAGSVMGIRGAGGKGASHHLALAAAAAFELPGDAVFRLDGRMGRATGGRVGDHVRLGMSAFDGYGASLAIGSAAAPGDLLTAYVRRPVAVSDGSAEITIARSSAIGGYDLMPVKIDLAPSARQVDFGVEYLLPTGRNAGVALAVRHAVNHGSVAGTKRTEAGVSFTMRF